MRGNVCVVAEDFYYSIFSHLIGYWLSVLQVTSALYLMFG
jgi:hypothetical protein